MRRSAASLRIINEFTVEYHCEGRILFFSEFGKCRVFEQALYLKLSAVRWVRVCAKFDRTRTFFFKFSICFHWVSGISFGVCVHEVCVCVCVFFLESDRVLLSKKKMKTFHWKHTGNFRSSSLSSIHVHLHHSSRKVNDQNRINCVILCVCLDCVQLIGFIRRLSCTRQDLESWIKPRTRLVLHTVHLPLQCTVCV